MPRFNSTNYPSVLPLRADLHMVRQASTGRIKSVLHSVLERRAHASSFAVLGNGTSDDTAVLQAALTELSNNGGGSLDITGLRIRCSSISVPSGVSIVGSCFHDPRDSNLLETLDDAILLQTGATITVHEASALERLKILPYGATFPQAAAAVAAWTGTAVTIAAGGHAATFEYLTIVGFAQGIDMLGASFTEQTRVYKTAIDCLNGVRIVSGTDRIVLDEVACWPTAAMGLGGPVDADYRRPGKAFSLETSIGIDAPSCVKCFSYGYADGFYLDSVNGATFYDCVADYTATKSTTVYGWRVVGNSSVTKLTNCTTYRSTYGVAFAPNQANHFLLITACCFQYCDNAGILISNGAGIIIGSLFQHVGSGTYTTYGIQLNNCTGSTRFSVDCCAFDGNTNSYGITGTSPGNVLNWGSNNFVTGSGTNIYLGGGLATYASAATVDIPADANSFFISGSVPISAVNASYGAAGRKIYMRFLAACTVNHTAVLKLAGSVNKNFAIGDLLGLEWTGSAWEEFTRVLR